ncbi:DNA cytosine methyltransferase [Serratia fonticola]
MTAYYNEIDPYAAQWLRNLIAAGHIAPGDVDERSIEDVKPDDIKHYTQCHFFAGVGVWSYALRNAGWPDDKPVWTGSCPCQPFSLAGKQLGKSDERHLAPVWLDLIKECQPTELFGEQVASAIKKHWLDDLFNELESQGYACGASVFPACGVGATDIRTRLYFCAANTNCQGLQGAYEHGKPRAPEIASAWGEFARIHAASNWKAWLSESGDPAIIDGATGRVGRTRAYGNAINAEAAKEFILAYIEARNEMLQLSQRAIR